MTSKTQLTPLGQSVLHAVALQQPPPANVNFFCIKAITHTTQNYPENLDVTTSPIPEFSRQTQTQRNKTQNTTKLHNAYVLITQQY